MVQDVEYVNQILDRLKTEHPEIWDSILYVEQPFPHELDELNLDVHSLSERKPLFLDESAHDWRYVEYGRRLGWSGVALKTCKTQMMGVESNAMQFYPDASMAEAKVHPGLYKRVGGKLNLATLGGTGFGYRIGDIDRTLPDKVKLNS